MERDAEKDARATEVLRDLLTRGAFLAARKGLKTFAPETRVRATLMDGIPGGAHLAQSVPGRVLVGPMLQGDRLAYWVRLDRPCFGMELVAVEHEKLTPE